jgi:hypothetical protein
VKDFAYTGSAQNITLPKGNYKLEVWGAQGGDSSNIMYGGKGGYSYGNITLNQQTLIYIYVGGKGTSHTTINSSGKHDGGFNGGGSSYTSYSSTNGTRSAGGGATDIRINNDSLYARVIVAGGGGGSYYYKSGQAADGGYAGGENGGDGLVGKGGTQNAGGTGYDTSNTGWIAAGFGIRRRL